MSQTPVPYLVGPAPVVVMECPVAGFQYYGGEGCWARMRLHDRVSLRREPGNRHDQRAIRVEWNDVLLGYVPHEANYALAQMMDGGARVEAQVVSMQRCADPWRRVMLEVGWVPSAAWIAQPEPAKPAVPPDAVSDLLIRSLVNRVFGRVQLFDESDWVRAHAAAIALVGVEHPAMLPFLRLVRDDKAAAPRDDPLAALHHLLTSAGMKPEAWKRLPRWGFGAFQIRDAWISSRCIARHANLLLRLDLQGPPPREFLKVAITLAHHRAPQDWAMHLERYPAWFVRAIVKALERTPTPAGRRAVEADLRGCIDWLLDARPSADANQQAAGWDWIVARAQAHQKARALAALIPWSVPVGEMTFGPWWVVPLRNAADLAEEAAAMKNCLEDYADTCRAGDMVIFSIRDALTSEREACLAITRAQPDAVWEFGEIAGAMNEPASIDAEVVAELVVERMNRC